MLLIRHVWHGRNIHRERKKAGERVRGRQERAQRKGRKIKVEPNLFRDLEKRAASVRGGGLDKYEILLDYDWTGICVCVCVCAYGIRDRERGGGLWMCVCAAGPKGICPTVIYRADSRYTKGRVRLIIKKNVWHINYPRGSKKWSRKWVRGANICYNC